MPKKSDKQAANLVSTICEIVRSTAGKDQSVVRLSDDVTTDIREWVSTGFPLLDSIMGGGWPVGAAVEVFGPEASGKSAMTHLAMRKFQDAGGFVVVVDAENSCSLKKFKKLGIDPERVVLIVPDHAEQAWDKIWKIVDRVEADNLGPVLFVWDSVAATQSKMEADAASSEDMRMGVAACMAANCKRVFKRFRYIRATFIWINQEREDFGGRSFVKSYKTPGGRAIRFAATIRMRLYAWGIPKTGEKSGLAVATRIVKNKITRPFQSTVWVIDFGSGPSPEMTLWFQLMDRKMLRSVGAGKYRCSWHPPFSKADWYSVCSEAGFMEKSYAELAAPAAERSESADAGDEIG